MLCSHYEGVDQRIIDYWQMEEVSVETIFLQGGGTPAMVLIDRWGDCCPACSEAANHIKKNPSIPAFWVSPLHKPEEFRMQVPGFWFRDHNLIHLWKYGQSFATNLATTGSLSSLPEKRKSVEQGGKSSA